MSGVPEANTRTVFVMIKRLVGLAGSFLRPALLSVNSSNLSFT